MFNIPKKLWQLFRASLWWAKLSTLILILFVIFLGDCSFVYIERVKEETAIAAIGNAFHDRDYTSVSGFDSMMDRQFILPNKPKPLKYITGVTTWDKLKSTWKYYHERRKHLSIEIIDDRMKHLADFSNLKSLYIYQDINESNVKYLRYLSQIHTLEYLYIQNQTFTPEVFQNAKGLSHISLVNINVTGMTETERKRLVKTLPPNMKMDNEIRIPFDLP